MKILFVDDESKKLKRLYSAISQIEGINPEDLENVLDLKSAKAVITNTFTDNSFLFHSLYCSDFTHHHSHMANGLYNVSGTRFSFGTNH